MMFSLANALKSGLPHLRTLPLAWSFCGGQLALESYVCVSVQLLMMLTICSAIPTHGSDCVQVWCPLCYAISLTSGT